MWILVAIAIGSMALAGVISIVATRRTFAAFVFGFNTMALVTGIFVWHFGLGARAVVVLAMVAVYLVRMNWVLFVWSEQTALGKLDKFSPTAGKLAIPVVLANTVGWAYCLPFHFAVRNTSPLDQMDLIGVGMGGV